MQSARYAAQCLLWAAVVCLSAWLPPCFFFLIWSVIERMELHAFYCVWLASWCIHKSPFSVYLNAWWNWERVLFCKQAEVKGWAHPMPDCIKPEFKLWAWNNNLWTRSDAEQQQQQQVKGFRAAMRLADWNAAEFWLNSHRVWRYSSQAGVEPASSCLPETTRVHPVGLDMWRTRMNLHVSGFFLSAFLL